MGGIKELEIHHIDSAHPIRLAFFCLLCALGDFVVNSSVPTMSPHVGLRCGRRKQVV